MTTPYDPVAVKCDGCLCFIAFNNRPEDGGALPGSAHIVGDVGRMVGELLAREGAMPSREPCDCPCHTGVGLLPELHLYIGEAAVMGLIERDETKNN